MFGFFDFLFEGLSSTFQYFVDQIQGIFRILSMLDELKVTMSYAISSMPDVFGVFAYTCLSLILALGAVRLVTGGG